MPTTVRLQASSRIPNAFPPAVVDANRGTGASGRRIRQIVVAALASITFAAFGTLIAQAGDDAGVHDFLRSQVGIGSGRSTPSVRRAPTLPALFVPSAAANRSLIGYAPASSQTPFDRTRADDAAARLGRASRSMRPAFDDSGFGLGRGRGSTQATLYCVRLCDGFFFPVTSSSEDEPDQATCNRLCPTSETKLFSAPRGSDGIDDATAHGVAYKSLAQAYTYRTSVSRTCSCAASGVGLRTPAIDDDPTLQQGDVIVMDKGLRVFNGGQASIVKKADLWHNRRIGRASSAIDRSLDALALSLRKRAI